MYPASHDPRYEPAPPIPLPKALVFFGALWLLGSWMLAMGFRTPIHPIAASFTPGVRMMLQCMAVGLVIGWPLLRLSQDRALYPVRQTILDMLVLSSLVQVVVWPLRLVTVWSVQRTAAMDATLMAWLLVSGAAVAASIGTNDRVPRIISMVTCVLFCMFGPLMSWVSIWTGGVTADISVVSPLTMLHALGEGGAIEPAVSDWLWIGLVAGTGLTLWIFLIIRSIPRLPRSAQI